MTKSIIDIKSYRLEESNMSVKQICDYVAGRIRTEKKKSNPIGKIDFIEKCRRELNPFTKRPLWEEYRNMMEILNP